MGMVEWVVAAYSVLDGAFCVAYSLPEAWMVDRCRPNRHDSHQHPFLRSVLKFKTPTCLSWYTVSHFRSFTLVDIFPSTHTVFSYFFTRFLFLLWSIFRHILLPSLWLYSLVYCVVFVTSPLSLISSYIQ